MGRPEAQVDGAVAARDVERPVVLLVDDEHVIRALGRRILERHGFVVLDASSATDALRVARDANRIDLLVTDLSMPGMNGHDLAEELTRDDDRLAVLFLSGAGVHELERAVGARRASAFLEKPFTPGSLVDALRQLLGRET